MSIRLCSRCKALYVDFGLKLHDSSLCDCCSSEKGMEEKEDVCVSGYRNKLLESKQP